MLSQKTQPLARSQPSPEAIDLDQCDGYFRARFTAMGGPCEVLAATSSRDEALAAARVAAQEAWRIDRTYSRFREDNLIHAINVSCGQPVELSEECAKLLDFADTCYRLSDGLFDITCGALQRAWRFDGGEYVPSRQEIDDLLQITGWHRVRWDRPWLTMPEGMCIDLGGLGKEYAVDRALALSLAAVKTKRLLVNFAGDVAAADGRSAVAPWLLQIERPKEFTGVLPPIALSHGAIATSGTSHRYVERAGKRYGHIIDPRTGYPIGGAPLSVTVLAPSCLQAGMACSIAMLKGSGAERFLKRQSLRHWICR